MFIEKCRFEDNDCIRAGPSSLSIDVVFDKCPIGLTPYHKDGNCHGEEGPYSWLASLVVCGNCDAGLFYSVLVLYLWPMTSFDVMTPQFVLTFVHIETSPNNQWIHDSEKNDTSLHYDLVTKEYSFYTALAYIAEMMQCSVRIFQT